MQSLNEIQGAIFTFIRKQTETDVAQAQTLLSTALNHDSEEELIARLSIYRNNSFYAQIEALKALYSATAATVGDDFFVTIAKEYIAQTQAVSPTMIDYGAHFDVFLCHHPTLKNYPYLPDLAGLEWKRHLSYHACDAEPLIHDDFSKLTEDELAQARFTLHPSVQLIRSNFPVFDIWQLAQSADEITDKTPTVSLDNPQSVLIVRESLVVVNVLITPDLFFFLKAIIRGLSLGDAIELTLEEFPKSDVSHDVAFLFGQQLIISIYGETP